ncbi:hypothetical protein HYV49_05350 [Candidatus Pacearchaeota archaeon]|nr:hypothetical protein [Candidatus Pacearchaeota archaeon]
MSSWSSYPKVYQLGHKAIEELLLDSVIVEEKLDASQFSFGLFNEQLKARSHHKELILDAPDKMFLKAVEIITQLKNKLIQNWTYRAEYFQKPKHSTLTYSRIPKNHLIIFDINTELEQYLSYEEKKKEADRLGLETVPLLYQGKVNSAEQVKQYLELESILGRTKIEGVVLKNYERFGRDGKALMGKYVSEKFKELNKLVFKGQSRGHIIDRLISELKTKARWMKSVQHLNEQGLLTNTPKDIGNLIMAVKKDIMEEEGDRLKEKCDEKMFWLQTKFASRFWTISLFSK